MLVEFEQQLANVLGGRLPAPHTGRVAVSPGSAATNTMRVILGVTESELIEADFLAHRDLRLLGSDAFRRVVHLRCTVRIQPRTNASRANQMPMLDAILFALDAPDFRDGTALLGGDDPGFLIERMRITGHTMPLMPNANDLAGILLSAEGWFWPVGVPEEEGPEIREALVRAGFLPMQLVPAAPLLNAGGEAVPLTLRFGATGTMRLRGPGEDPQSLPFGSLALTLLDAGGRPGAGTLTGGGAGQADGDEVVRLVPVTDGGAEITYTPGAQASVDFLVVSIDDREGGRGLELARFRLEAR